MKMFNNFNRVTPFNAPISKSQWFSATSNEIQAASLTSSCSLDASARCFAWPFLLTAGLADFRDAQEQKTRLHRFSLLQNILSQSSAEISQYYQSQASTLS
jgi:hypothetical protein